MGVDVTDPLSLLQILCGIWFVPHLIGKVQNFDKAYLTFEKAGFRPGRVFLVLTIVLEALAGLGLALNIFPKVAAALAVIVLLGASYAVVKINGVNWRWQKQGPEYMVFWSAACILSVMG